MTHRAAADIDAPAEVVFNVVTDPDRLARWLPSQLTVADTGTERLRVSWDGAADAREYRLVVLPERLRVEWRPSGPDGWPGFLQVHDNPAGGATAEACVEPAGQVGGVDRAPEVLDAAMTNLRREVKDSLTAG
jgi:uncharacterized protein YndB with AHSA1/START domain